MEGFDSVLSTLKSSALLSYLEENPDALLHPECAFLLAWLRRMAPLAKALLNDQSTVHGALKSRLPAPPLRASAPTRPESPPHEKRTADGPEAAGHDADANVHISDSPLISEPQPRLPASRTHGEGTPPLTEAQAASMPASEASVSKHSRTSFHSPHTLASEPTPQLPSPPKTIDRGLFRASCSGTRGELLRGAETPDFYMRQPDLSSPSPPSPPRSIKRQAPPASDSDSADADYTALARSTPPLAADNWDDEECDFSTAGARVSPCSPASPLDVTELPWVVAPTTPLSGRQLRLTPARKARQSREGIPRAQLASAQRSSSHRRSHVIRSESQPSSAVSAALHEAVAVEATDASAVSSASQVGEVAVVEGGAARPVTLSAAASEVTAAGTPAPPPSAHEGDVQRSNCVTSTAPAVVVSDVFFAARNISVENAIDASPSALAARVAQPAVPTALPEATMCSHACAPLNLSRFPGHFQQGTAASQLVEVYDALCVATTPPTVATLAAGCLQGFEPKRIALLLEVMHSRKIVAASGSGAERQWAVVHDS